MTRKSLISLMVTCIFLMFGSTSPGGAIVPYWNYEIENMTQVAMSGNGEYLIAACGEVPSCTEGQFYVFDRYGNILKNGCTENKITAVDIAENGIFFIGTEEGYYFSSDTGSIQGNGHGDKIESGSISKNGEIAIAGTEKEILIIDRIQVKSRGKVDQPVRFTAINASGDTALAGTNETLFLYKSGVPWAQFPTGGTITALALSDDGSTIACSAASGTIRVLDAHLKEKGLHMTEGYVTSIALSADGSFLVCGTQNGEVLLLNSSGEEIWTLPLEKVIQEVFISSDGGTIAILHENILLVNSLGKKLRELKSSETIHSMQFSTRGDTLCYSQDNELIFLELYHYDSALTHEYMLPSKRTTTGQDRLNIAWSFDAPPRSVIAADINGDRKKEIICSLSNEVVVLNSKGEVLWRKSFSFGFEIAALDLTLDFVPEVVVTSRDNSMGFYVFDGIGKALGRTEFYSRWYTEPPSEEQSIRIKALWSGDIDNDEMCEVVCTVSAGYLLEPRGIYVFEYPSFEEEWFYPSAPLIDTVNIVDLDNDGDLEIVCGSEGPCNGRKVGSTDDCHAYVFAVDLQGKELWMKEIGTGSKGVSIAVADIDGDMRYEVVCGGWSDEDNWGELSTLRIDSSDRDRERVTLDHSVYVKGVSDLNADGYMEILVCDTKGNLTVYNYNFQLVTEKNVSILHDHDITINDLDGDRQKEIVMSAQGEEGKKRIVILNSSLENEWSVSFQGYSPSALVENLSFCMNSLLIWADKMYLYSFKDTPTQPCELSLMLSTQEEIQFQEEIDDHIEKGDEYYRNGDYLKAVQEFDRAIDMLQQMGDTERYPGVVEKRTKAQKEYNAMWSEIDKSYEEGIQFLESGDFQEAGKALLEASKKYKELGNEEKVQAANEKLLIIADQLFKDGIIFLESEDLKEARETFADAKEIYDYLQNDRARETQDRLNEVEDLSKAQRFIVDGENYEDLKDYRKAIEYYERALKIYKERGRKELSDEIQAIIERARIERDKLLVSANKVIIAIVFIASFIVVSVLFIRNKEYKGVEKRENTIFLLATIVTLVLVLMVSWFSLSYPLGEAIYIVTFSMCLFFLVILSTYLKRVLHE